ncbi:GNAT family N-acetyltransferase [Clostridium sp.]|uniref:GNAT family N-acetyltransferase n=1 Tax=Clostridium sp. TaxID=1506 RepID=UPI0025BDE84C|nr:GNAT family N-acetyltransferase [Clostridium sp.]
MVNTNNEILDQYIVLKKYINDKEHKKIKDLECICINKDKVNLKLELEYRTQINKDYKNDSNDINEYLYYINDKLVGYLGVSCFGGNIAEINGMVHPDFRRRKIFTKLVEMAIEECKRRNFNKVLLLGDEKSNSATEFIKNTKSSYSFSECRMECDSWDLYKQNKGILLKTAKNKDIDQIDNLNEIFFGEGCNEIILPEDDEKNNISTYLIQVDDKIIGKIKVSKEFNSAFISGFGIIPEYRNKGYGRAVLMQVLNYLKHDGINKAALDVEIKNKNALNLYKSCGFKEKSTMNYYEINGTVSEIYLI